MEHGLVLNPVELAGALFSITYIILSIRENIWLWPVGFFASLFYIIVFFQEGFYAGMSLQLYYLIISVYGWFKWLEKHDDKTGVKTPIRVISINQRKLLTYITVMIGLTIVIFLLLSTIPGMLNLPPSSMPWSDAFITAGGIVATYMLAMKILENWLIWVVVNSFAIGVYFYQELFITALLFTIYAVMAVIGYRRWKGNMAKCHQ